MKRFLIIGALLCSSAAYCAETVELPEVLDKNEVFVKEATPENLVEACRTMVPEHVQIEGRIILRNRRGIVQAEYNYILRRDLGETELKIFDENGKAVQFEKRGRILSTDVTWSDLTLDYLWWDDFGYDSERESESVHGQVCSIILMRKDDRVVRVWVDKKTGAMMQAEELSKGKPVRRLWGTRIKKFGDRWAPNVLEVETIGFGHRTKITVETLI